MSSKIIVALDVNTIDDAKRLVQDLGDSVGMYKIGLQLITKQGPGIFTTLLSENQNARFFYDAKFHDIPNTVWQATRNAAEIPGIKFISVHATTGHDALEKAADAAEQKEVKILGITALTSLGEEECRDIFNKSSRFDIVQNLKSRLVAAGVQGMVCSPNELTKVVPGVRPDLIKVVPGIRPDWANANDQKAFNTPYNTIKQGADYLVIGRPIRTPPPSVGSPLEAAQRIGEEIERALNE